MRKVLSFVLIWTFAVTMLGCAERTSTTSGSNSPFPSTSPSTSDQGPVYASNSASPGEVPAGTTLVIRTDQEIRADQPTDRTYTGEIAREVVGSNGQVLIPKNSRVDLSVYPVNDKELELGVRSVRINGQTYQVNTGTETRNQKEGIGMNRRTATMVGGGALLGTLIGAIAGGGKGAAVGAAVGAGAGAATQVLTRGKEVNIPAESELTFRLDQPLYLEGYRGSSGR
jgi:hypothetical protein